MHPALRLNLHRSAALSVPVDLVRAADDLGYHSVWSAEAYGTDALSPLAYLAAFTRRIKLGTAIAQLAARPPATVAARVAAVPSDLTQINKPSVHWAFDVWGARAAIRAGTELQALAGHTRTAEANRRGLLDRMKGQGAKDRA